MVLKLWWVGDIGGKKEENAFVADKYAKKKQ